MFGDANDDRPNLAKTVISLHAHTHENGCMHVDGSD